MAEIMMGLGTYRFGIGTAAYQTLERATAYRWAAQDRLGRLPARQFLGPGEDGITLSGVIYPHYRGGLRQLDRLRQEAGRGEPLDLVDGYGRVWGAWVVLAVRETQSALLANGAPLKVEFQVELAAYGEDSW
ncbi:phage tail protein [Rhodocista pekingensis]|uniref:Phage tail protein n=1 Tax=Rhodocista pekingensis TaxID=201185 RepID=A0ABW2KTT9_9PROT